VLHARSPYNVCTFGYTGISQVSIQILECQTRNDRQSLAADQTVTLRLWIPSHLTQLELTYSADIRTPGHIHLATLFHDVTMPHLRILVVTFWTLRDLEEGTVEDVLTRFVAPALQRVELRASRRAQGLETRFSALCGLFGSASERGILHARIVDE
jgi:hypothetical protein